VKWVLCIRYKISTRFRVRLLFSPNALPEGHLGISHHYIISTSLSSSPSPSTNASISSPISRLRYTLSAPPTTPQEVIHTSGHNPIALPKLLTAISFSPSKAYILPSSTYTDPLCGVKPRRISNSEAADLISFIWTRRWTLRSLGAMDFGARFAAVV
jgi:hypothetical protein